MASANKDCELYPCQNGGSCIDKDNSFTCKCNDGYAGKMCTQGIYDYESN